MPEIKRFDEVESTNDLLKQQGENLPEGTVFVAESQTLGRGRKGRKFYSPKGLGLYFSILLKPEISGDEALLLTPMAAVAVAESIEAVYGVDARIKWVNDVFVDGKKVAGILTEAVTKGNKQTFFVTGIGINIQNPTALMPPELRNIAGGIAESCEEKEELLRKVLDTFFYYYKTLTKKEYLESYREKSLLIGKEIFIPDRGEEVYTAVGIDDSFGLIIENKNGERETLFCGEVSVKLS